jgi:hypothetical protein
MFDTNSLSMCDKISLEIAQSYIRMLPWREQEYAALYFGFEIGLLAHKPVPKIMPHVAAAIRHRMQMILR